METIDVFRVTFIMTGCAFFWLDGYSRHKNVDRYDITTIELPYVLGLLFGRYWLQNDNYFDIRGVGVQVLSSSFGLLYFSYTLGLLPMSIFSYGITCAIGFVAITALIYSTIEALDRYG